MKGILMYISMVIKVMILIVLIIILTKINILSSSVKTIEKFKRRPILPLQKLLPDQK